jgi:hypothetical protein
LKHKFKENSRVSRAGSLRDDANYGRDKDISGRSPRDSIDQIKNSVSREGSLRDDAERGKDA